MKGIVQRLVAILMLSIEVIYRYEPFPGYYTYQHAIPFDLVTLWREEGLLAYSIPWEPGKRSIFGKYKIPAKALTLAIDRMKVLPFVGIDTKTGLRYYGKIPIFNRRPDEIQIEVVLGMTTEEDLYWALRRGASVTGTGLMRGIHISSRVETLLRSQQNAWKFIKEKE